MVNNVDGCWDIPENGFQPKRGCPDSAHLGSGSLASSFILKFPNPQVRLELRRQLTAMNLWSWSAAYWLQQRSVTLDHDSRAHKTVKSIPFFTSTFPSGVGLEGG